MQIVPAVIAHARPRPQRNAFRYRICYFAVPLSRWTRGRVGTLLSIDRFNLYSLRSADYGDRRMPPAKWIKAVLSEHNIVEADGEVLLLTLPRLMGYAFNPLSFWFCLDAAGQLRAVLAEVNNTFGERHCYLCVHPDHRVIRAEEWLDVRKIFHVSPFMEAKGFYRFRFDLNDDRIAVAINLFDDSGLLLTTSIDGRRYALTTAAQIRSLFAYPLQTVMVVVRIHYQAAKLFWKRVGHYRKPAPPQELVSR